MNPCPHPYCRQERRRAKEAKHRVSTLLALALALLTAAGPVFAAPTAPEAKMYDMRSGKAISQTSLLDTLAQADVVCVGEQHTDPATHHLELAILTGLHARLGTRLTLGMEMWERDVQPPLDSYLHGKTDEATFLKVSRPWSNYQTDYRPLVEFAKTNAVPVVATNVPQPLATAVGRHGLAALKDAPPGQVATDIHAPHDQAWTRFRAVMLAMGGAHGGMTMDEATLARFYDAQVVRDETMAESITRTLNATPGAFVLHINGQFHSDYGDGIPRRILWRRPLTKVLIVSIIPVPDPARATPPPDKTLADYVIYVPAPPATP